MSANQQRALNTVRDWNKNFRPGTVVLMGGIKHVTDSPAGLGVKDAPVVFLKGIDIAVPLASLDVPGWVVTGKRGK